MQPRNSVWLSCMLKIKPCWILANAPRSSNRVLQFRHMSPQNECQIMQQLICAFLRMHQGLWDLTQEIVIAGSGDRESYLDYTVLQPLHITSFNELIGMRIVLETLPHPCIGPCTANGKIGTFHWVLQGEEAFWDQKESRRACEFSLRLEMAILRTACTYMYLLGHAQGDLKRSLINTITS